MVIVMRPALTAPIKAGFNANHVILTAINAQDLPQLALHAQLEKSSTMEYAKPAVHSQQLLKKMVFVLIVMKIVKNVQEQLLLALSVPLEQCLAQVPVFLNVLMDIQLLIFQMVYVWLVLDAKLV
jgi:hypothetical protein